MKSVLGIVVGGGAVITLVHLLNRNIHKNPYLQFAWNLHIERQFTFHALEYCGKEELVVREQYWLDITKCYERHIGYNLNKIANSQLGHKWSEESKKRQSAIQSGKKMSKEAIAKTVAGNTGKKRTPEQRARMSEAQRNWVRTPRLGKIIGVYVGEQL